MNNQRDIEILKNELASNYLSKREYTRILGVLRKKEGFRRLEITKFLGISLKALEQWITNYNKHGINGLKTEKRITSSTAKLTPEQIKAVEKLLKENTPVQLGISKQDYWDIPMLKILVKKRYKVEYFLHSSYTRLFKRCGFSYQRVNFQDIRRDSKEADSFKKRFEGKLKKGGSIVMSW